jgi:cold shock CspA family protein
MTGSIKNLNPLNHSGFITAENGQTVYFAASAVWAHDYPYLTVGQAVSFDLLEGQRPKAINVHLYEGRHVRLQLKKPEGRVELRFIGFDQTNTVRTFRFQAFIDGKEVREYAVTADITLFGKYHIGIQEGPALCSRLVAGLATSLTERTSLALTEKDILAHVESRRVPKRKAFRRRGRFVSPSGTR